MNKVHNTPNTAISARPITDIRLTDYSEKVSKIFCFQSGIIPQDYYTATDYADDIDCIVINGERVITDRAEIEREVTENFAHLRYALELNLMSYSK